MIIRTDGLPMRAVHVDKAHASLNGADGRCSQLIVE
jgi:hypothetical protein